MDTDKYIIVTGANGDIGLSICAGLMMDGFNVFYVSGHVDRINKLDTAAKE